MTVYSLEPISAEDMKKIEDILRESRCPHESLTKTFPRYSGMLDDIITFDGLNPKDYRGKQGDSPQT